MLDPDRQRGRAGLAVAWLGSITRSARQAIARRLDARTYRKLEQVTEARRAAAADTHELGHAYRGLLAELHGRKPSELGPAPTGPLPADALADDREAAARRYRWAHLVERVNEGDSLETAVVELVRDRIKAKRNAEVRSLVQSMETTPGTAAAGYLGSALIAADMNLLELAWACFDRVPGETRLRLAGSEYFQTAFLVDPAAATAEARRVLADAGIAPDRVPLSPRAWTDLVGFAFGAGEPVLAAEMHAHVRRQVERSPDRWATVADELAWLRPWLEPVPEPPPDPPDVLRFAVLDYKHPNPRMTAHDLGEYFTSLAVLGQLARHRNVSFTGPVGLGDLGNELRQRVGADRRLDTTARQVRLLPVNRDVTSRAPVTEPTWLIAAGSHQGSLARLRYDFPYHPGLRPIFISFHCERLAMLTEPAIEYLRRYGPVGCRDWSTVHLLLSVGVPAFFSGCITSTLDTVCSPPDPAEQPIEGAPVGYDQAEPPPDAPAGAVSLRAPAGSVRAAGLAANLAAAARTLIGAARDCDEVVATKSSWYLATRSTGAATRFVPRNPAEPELAGLLDLTDDDLAGMRDGILAKLAAVTSAVMDGAAEEEVYARWREACADDVAQAEQRHHERLPAPAPSVELGPVCAAIRAAEVRVERSAPGPDGDEVQVALALDGNLKEQLAVHLEGLVTHSSRSLRLWLLVRGHGEADHARLAALFPTVSFVWLPCDQLKHGVMGGVPKHITPSTFDRLLLPDLLAELDRIVYLDVDTLPLGDVSELYDWDLDGDPLAARSAVARHVISGFLEMYRSAKALSDRPADAHEAVRRMHARHRYDFTHFNAGVLVLDLRRMRKDGFCAEVIGYVEHYAINDQQTLNWYAGSHRAVLPPAWNARPTQEVVTDPRLIHWAGVQKPWKSAYVPRREHWREYEARVRDRAAALGLNDRESTATGPGAPTNG